MSDEPHNPADDEPTAAAEAAAIETAAPAEPHHGNGRAAEARPPFHYWDKGSLATIGRAAAVAQFGKIHISGFIAWLSWLFVHILFLIGFRNRLLVFIQWAWSYVTYERSARLITGSTYLPGWTAPEVTQVTAGKDMSQEIPSGARK